MCGRYTLRADAPTLQRAFNLPELPAEHAPRYNIAPTQRVPIVRVNGVRTLAYVQWGLVPSWAKDRSGAHQRINARAETLQEKPSFRQAFKLRRCLVPCDGFYEWDKSTPAKTPHFIHFADHRVFALAGLWETWLSPQGERLESCTIITTEPNALIAPLHHRMAVILAPQDYDTWLNPETPLEACAALLRPHSAADMCAYPVSPAVSNPNVDTPDLIAPYQPPRQATLL